MKVAIIGCGKQAPKHIKGFLDNGINEIILYDINTDFSQKLASEFDLKHTENLDEIFDDSSINAVDICTPVKFHKELIEKAIKSKKHFFCEKPLTDKVSDDEDVLKLLESYEEVVGMVGYIYRFAPALVKCKDILEAEDLGKVHTAFLRIGGRGNHMKWKHQKATGGGALNEMAVHMIDLAYWYFGKFSKIELVEADTRLPKRNINGEEVFCDSEDYLLIKLVSETGVNVTIMADFVTPAFSQYLEIQGENGSFTGSIQPNYKNQLFLINETDNYGKGFNELDIDDHNIFKHQIKHFVDSVKTSSQPKKCSIHDSLEVMKVQDVLKEQLKKLNVTSEAA